MAFWFRNVIVNERSEVLGSMNMTLRGFEVRCLLAMLSLGHTHSHRVVVRGLTVKATAEATVQ